MTAVLVKPSNLCGELIRPKNDSSSILISSPFSSYVRVRRMKNSEVIKIKSKDLSLSFNKSHSNNRKFKIRGESTVDLYYRKPEKEEEEGVNERINADKLHRWIEQSIQEIVKNIGEAPFLMQIYSQGSSQLKLKKEEASPNSWHVMKKRWNESYSTPDGIILVEQLKDEEAMNDEVSNDKYSNGDSKTWGLVVQGRGMDCPASCYILNTCRVKSTAGFCTHFCLVRAKCFGESLDTQLTKAWLQ